MTLGFLTRPRSRKRILLISLAALLLWYFSPSTSTLSSTTTSTTSVVDYLLARRPAIYSQMLDHHQKPLCPRFSKYDRQKLLLLEPTECTPIETEHPDFSADICFSPFVCNEGLVRIRRRDRVCHCCIVFACFIYACSRLCLCGRQNCDSSSHQLKTFFSLPFLRSTLHNTATMQGSKLKVPDLRKLNPRRLPPPVLWPRLLPRRFQWVRETLPTRLVPCRTMSLYLSLPYLQPRKVVVGYHTFV